MTTNPSGTRHDLEPAGARPPSPRHWWDAGLARPTLRELMRKRNAPALCFLAAWLATLACTTALLALAWGTLWVIPAVVAHGAVLSFAYAASHECAHVTAFSTTWLNEVVFYITSFVFGEEPMYRRYSHSRHHAYTWYPRFDSQMPYHNPMTLRTYLRETLGLVALCDGLKLMSRHALGKLNDDERAFVPAARIGQLQWGTRAFLAGYAAIAASAVAVQSWFLIVAFFGARCAGGWIVQLHINSQHMCMGEALPDHRYSTRSLNCNPFTRVLYWNMNFHVEHHLHPGVPFHALPALNRLVAAQLPLPSRGALGANREILRVIRAQATDPGHFARPQFAANAAPAPPAGF